MAFNALSMVPAPALGRACKLLSYVSDITSSYSHPMLESAGGAVDGRLIECLPTSISPTSIPTRICLPWPWRASRKAAVFQQYESVEGVACDIERLHLGIADLDAFLVMARIERALNFEAGFGCWLPRWTRPPQYDLSAVWRARSG
jgi:hypothetical protein